MIEDVREQLISRHEILIDRAEAVGGAELS
jgi:hypothetical protein